MVLGVVRKGRRRLHYKYKVPAVVEPGAGRDLRLETYGPDPAAGTVNTCPAKGSDTPGMGHI